LPVVRACELPVCPPERRWLIVNLWADEAVGIVGGEPNCGKSFLALDMVAQSPAACRVCAGSPQRGAGRCSCTPLRTALHLVRTRLDGICRAAHDRLEVVLSSRTAFGRPIQARYRDVCFDHRPRCLHMAEI
jgi:hypothetical protein